MLVESHSDDFSKHNKIGIEEIGFYTSNLCFSLERLAQYNKQDSAKYIVGLGQEKMSIISIHDDIITMAYNAAAEFLSTINKQKIDLLLFATESDIDHSRSAASILRHELELSEECRCLDIKHACYGGTGAINIARDFVYAHSNKKVLVVMSDIAFYGIGSPGEPTQGCGAIAMLISTEPKIATFNDDDMFYINKSDDFYRPAYQVNPIYDGHLSVRSYLEMFARSMKIYYQKSEYFDFLISHMPFTKMLSKCCKLANIDADLNSNDIICKYQKLVGNTYTASLYIGLLSLLENIDSDLSDKKLALFSYGSGAQCALFSVSIIRGYQKHLRRHMHLDILQSRQELDYDAYCSSWKAFELREKALNWKNKTCNIPVITQSCKDDTNKLEIYEIKNGVRLYKKVSSN